MRLKFISDGSMEGLKLKKKLESISIENMDQNSLISRWKKWIDGNIENSFTIRWGNWTDDENEGLVFNSKQAIRNCIDKENMILTLRRNHLRSPRRIKPGKKTEFPIIGRKYIHKSGTDIRIIDSLDEYKRCDCDYFIKYLNIVKEYRVHIMDLEAFLIEEKYKDEEDLREPIIRTEAFGWSLRRIDLEEVSNIEKEKILSLAQKGIHALGLDFGVVTIGKGLNNRYYILDIDPSCRWMTHGCLDAYKKQFIETILKYDNLINNKQNITIGADPECLLKDKENEKLILASDFFQNEGSFGLDERSIEAGKKFFPLMEIRPKHSLNPIEVFQSIEVILTDVYRYIHYKNVGLYAGSMPIYNYWIGGHIHFGMKPNAKLVKALDTYLAIPMMMIEKSHSARQRKSKYGILGNYREKSHGGFEYCSISSWLVSPKITVGVLCLAKVIAQEYLNIKDEIHYSYSDVRAYYLVNKGYFKDKIKSIIKNIKNTYTYKIYKPKIDYLFEMIESGNEWSEEIDIKQTWGLGSSDEIYKVSTICKVPKKKRLELGLNIGEKMKIDIGNNIYDVEVYPKDDLSVDKSGYITLSEDLCEATGLGKLEELCLWKNDDIYKAGPVFGIFSYVERNYLGPFGMQTYLFRKLIKLSQNKGIMAYVFTIWDVDWDEGRVKGYTYDFEKEAWYRKKFPIPDIIYDRGDIINEENYEDKAKIFLENIEKNNIKFINDLKCIELTNDKLKAHFLLNTDDKIRPYLPETIEWDSDEAIKYMTQKYNNIYIKLKDGSRSKGIFYI